MTRLQSLDRQHRHVQRAARNVLLLTILVACHDAMPDPVTAPSGPDKVLVECIDPTQPDCASDPSDTHVSADITLSSTYTVTFDHEYKDPMTGQPSTVLSVSPDPVHVHVEAGYYPSGRVNIHTTYSDGADATTLLNPQVTEQQLSGDSLADLNTYGSQLALSTPDAVGGAPVMNLVGSTLNGDITAGWLVDISDTITTSSVAMPLGTATSPVLAVSPNGQKFDRYALGREFATALRGEPVHTTLNGVPVVVRRRDASSIEIEDESAVPPESTLKSIGRASRSMSASTNAEAQYHQRTFVRHADKWVLFEDRNESDIADEHTHKHHSVVQTFTHVKWFSNAKRDSMRRAARPTTAWIPRQTASAASSSANLAAPQGQIRPPTSSSRFIMCDDACGGSGGGGVNPVSGPQPLGAELPCINDVASQSSPNGTLNILYQHGFKSDATTWCQMDRYVRQRFYVHNEIRHTTGWKASYEDQSADLGAKLQADAATLPGPYVMVGHSNGGLVSRYTAQSLTAPSLISTVITISSPHAGAYLANIDQAILTTAMAIPLGYAMAGCDVADTFICRHGGSVGTELAAILSPIFLYNAVPVTQEMGTDAPFHDTINGRRDWWYRTAGIRNRIWDRWTPWRLMADNSQCVPSFYIPCDAYSRTYVNAVDETYHQYVDCSVISGILGIVWPGARDTARHCALMAGSMKAIDYAYKRLSVASDHGDGVVPEHSQYYPDAPSNRQFLVDDSNSHIGETRSQHTSLAVHAAINQVAGIPFDQ